MTFEEEVLRCPTFKVSHLTSEDGVKIIVFKSDYNTRPPPYFSKKNIDNLGTVFSKLDQLYQ